MEEVLDGGPLPCFKLGGSSSHIGSIYSDSEITLFHVYFVFQAEFVRQEQSHHFGQTGYFPSRSRIELWVKQIGTFYWFEFVVIDSESSSCEFARVVLHFDGFDAVSIHALGGRG